MPNDIYFLIKKKFKYKKLLRHLFNQKFPSDSENKKKKKTKCRSMC